MYITLHLAVSHDGYIAKLDGDSSWVSSVDEDLFVKRAREAGCLVVGRRTFEQYRGSIYPISAILNIVLTTDAKYASLEPNVVTASSADEAVTMAQEKGIHRMLVAGGAQTARAFYERGIVNEIYLSVHPLVLGAGISVLEGLEGDARYSKKEEKELEEGLIERHYVMV